MSDGSLPGDAQADAILQQLLEEIKAARKEADEEDQQPEALTPVACELRVQNIPAAASAEDLRAAFVSHCRRMRDLRDRSITDNGLLSVYPEDVVIKCEICRPKVAVRGGDGAAPASPQHLDRRRSGSCRTGSGDENAADVQQAQAPQKPPNGANNGGARPDKGAGRHQSGVQGSAASTAAALRPAQSAPTLQPHRNGFGAEFAPRRASGGPTMPAAPARPGPQDFAIGPPPGFPPLTPPPPPPPSPCPPPPPRPAPTGADAGKSLRGKPPGADAARRTKTSPHPLASARPPSLAQALCRASSAKSASGQTQGADQRSAAPPARTQSDPAVPPADDVPNTLTGYVIVRIEAQKFFLEADQRIPCSASRHASRAKSAPNYLAVRPSNRGRHTLDRACAEELQLLIGYMRIVDADASKILWCSEPGLKFEIRATTRVLAIYFANKPLPLGRRGLRFTHVLELHLMSVRSPVRVVHGACGEWILQLSFRSWPWLFRLVPSATGQPGEQDAVRTTDFTSLQAFGFPTLTLQLVSPPPYQGFDAENRLLDLFQRSGTEVIEAQSPDGGEPKPTNRACPWSDRLHAFLRDCQRGEPQLPFAVAWTITMMVHEGRLATDHVDKRLIKVLCDAKDWWRAHDALRNLAAFVPRRQVGVVKRPHEALRRALDAAVADEPAAGEESGAEEPSGQEMMVRRVVVTPLRVIAALPEVERSNRILRTYRSWADRFMRVTFSDEGKGYLNTDPDVLARIESFLMSGIDIAGRHFKFLAYGSSQLREYSAWFYCEDSGRPGEAEPPTLASILAGMGDLRRIKVPSKYAARIGQCFSATVSTVQIRTSQRLVLPDVYPASSSDYCFSDGVGVISPAAAALVVRSMPQLHVLGRVPSAFQIRWGGTKGVLAVWPGILPDGCMIGTRESMDKFPSDSTQLEVVEYARKLPCHLNRQIIFILHALGVQDKHFKDIFRRTVAMLDMSVKGGPMALAVLSASGFRSMEWNPLIDPHFQPSMHTAFEMIRAGLAPDKEPYLRALLQAFRVRKLRDIQERCRMPIAKAVTLLGVMDESGELPEDTVYFQCTDFMTGEHTRLAPGTLVAVGRSPCLHPGDIRLLKVADYRGLPPALTGLMDVVVFPRVGARPLPSQMSGGDLDGDMFFIIWDERLLPTKNEPPMEFATVLAPEVEGGVTMKDIAAFFVDYMKNDNLGVISNTHTALADRLKLGVKDPSCIALAGLYSKAVDFPKSGVPASSEDLDRHKRFLMYPDFMEKPVDQTYESKTVVGWIYRESRAAAGRHVLSSAVSRQSTKQPTTQRAAAPARGQHTSGLSGDSSVAPTERHEVDPRLLVPGHEKHLPEARRLFRRYKTALLKLMQHVGCFSDAEVNSSHVYAFSRSGHNRKRHRDFQERLDQAVAKLRATFYHGEFLTRLPVGQGVLSKPALQLASAWYRATYEADQATIRILSFPWILMEQLKEIMKQSN